ncbi:unnamed protein product, partial [Oppiella nova]
MFIRLILVDHGDDPESQRPRAYASLRSVGRVSADENRHTIEILVKHVSNELGVNANDFRVDFVDTSPDMGSIKGTLYRDLAVYNYGQQYNQYDNHRYNDRDRYDRYGQRDYSGDNWILNITTGIMIGTDGYRDSGNNLHDDPCIQKALYYVKNCENTLIDDQRDARTGSHRNDVHLGLCCALYSYYDCVNLVARDECTNPSSVTVDILMGSRKRDLNQELRYKDPGYNGRDNPCIQRAVYYIKHCENILIDAQRDARKDRYRDQRYYDKYGGQDYYNDINIGVRDSINFPRNDVPQGQGYNNMFGSRVHFGGDFNSNFRQDSGNYPQTSGNYPQTSGNSCLERAIIDTRGCEDQLIQRQREDQRYHPSDDKQQLICCALYTYYDCLGRVAMEKCTDHSSITVDILMGSRKRDINQACRDYT